MREISWPSLDRPIDCIIPARGNSKRFPGKNIAKVLGHPLIGYVIESARLSNIFGRIVVNTEDAMIAKVAKEYGAEVMGRPMSLASDTSQVKDVVLYSLDQMDKEYAELKEPPKPYVAVIYPTAGLILPEDLMNVYKILSASGDIDGVMSVVRPSEHPLGAMKISKEHLKISGHHSLTPYFEDQVPQSQKWPELWMDAGAIYMYRSEAFRKRQFYPPALVGYVLPRTRAVDVDYPEDLKMIEALMGYEQRHREV